MKYSSKQTKIANEHVDCIVIGIFNDKTMTPSAKALDKASHHQLSNILDLDDFKGNLDETLLLHHIEHLKASRVLLVGCGDPSQLTETNYSRIITAAINRLKVTNCKSALFYLPELKIKKRDLLWKIRYSIQIIEANLYQFNEYKTKSVSNYTIEHIIFHTNNAAETRHAHQAIKEGSALVSGMNFMKRLANTPANVCIPSFIAQHAKALALTSNKIKVEVLEKKDLEKLGMNAILAVGQGSKNPPCCIIIHYQGTKASKPPIALVGKGITFDTGGISLKPAANMDDMKYDMCGAASILGAVKTASELNLPINIVAVLACAENMPGGNAYKPGDIIKTLSGQMVEVLNTDAEGRMVLCDALTYCERFNPEVVIDVATLTGAIVIALGSYASGLFCDDEKLRQSLLKAGDDSQDFTWHMPIVEEYQTRIENTLADFSNITYEQGAGSIIAACFLARFTKNFRWAHLDVAAITRKNGKEKSATGRPVPILVHYLLNYSK
ncbi:MAG: leucyl aminopeptidase [Gammaproteobacteria bacterium]